jgi:purine-binding chemotaxis protein CheW
MPSPVTPDEAVKRVLADRARSLARPLRAERPADLVDVVTFSVADDRYGVEANRVQEVFRLGTIAMLPGAPVTVAGLTSNRGDLLTLLDLRAVLGLAGADRSALTRGLLLEPGRRHVAIAVDAVDSIVTVSRGELSAPTTSAVVPADLVIGITRDALTVVSVEALFRHFDGGVHS